MDRLLAIRVFGRLVETGGFNRAADALRLPKSTVTKLIQGLETELGVRLLERTTRRVAVTAEGAAYYERTRQLLAELDDFEADLAGGGKSLAGSLRIDTGGSVAAQLLVPALPSFRSRYPGIAIQVGVTDRTVDLLAEGVDCAIRSTADDPTVVARQIALLPWTLCATPGYLAEHGTPTTPESLSGHEIVGYFSARTGRSQTARLSDESGAVRSVDCRLALEVNESNAHAAAGLAGLGMVQTLRFQVSDALADGTLVEVLPQHQPQPLPVYVVYPPARRHNPRVRAFVEWIAEELPRRANAGGAP